MKSFKMMGFGTRKSKKGFTLIELLIVMVILAILAGVIVMAVSGVFKSAGDTAYNTTKEQLQDAVALYSANSTHPGTYPRLASIADTSGCTGCSVINISALLVSEGGLLQSYPDGLYANITARTANNCNVSAADANCKAENHYVWLINVNNGSVFSYCHGAAGECVPTTDRGTDGFQGIWP
jgi:prepilin-type N-terminal cleavage/methylation domain-containing protein